jgi:hypothetical protein
MKFGAIAVIIGVIIILLGFSFPTMQIAPSPISVNTSYYLEGTTSVSQSLYSVGESVPLTFTWSYEHNNPVAIWDLTSIFGKTIHVFSKNITTQSGSYTFYWNDSLAGKYEFNVEYLTAYPDIYTRLGFATFSVTSQSTPATIPTIETVSGSPNPVYTGQTVTFSANVNWNGQPTGFINWEINGDFINGNTYVFNTAGTYKITVDASNNVGSDYKSFDEVVNSVNSPSNPNSTSNIMPELKNVGTFYMVASGQTYNLANSVNVNITAITYPVSIIIYYVQNHGQTQNLSGIVIAIGSNVYTLSLQNKTTYNGYNAYVMQLKLQAGSYTMTGYLKVTLSLNPIQAFSVVVNNIQSTQATSTSAPTLAFHINYVVIIVGILVMIGGAVLVKFGI